MILSSVAKRRAVDKLKDTLSRSERLACKVVRLSRSADGYRRPRPPPTPT